MTSLRQSPRIGDLERLAAVEATGLLDTPPEAAFDDLAALAAELTGSPYAFVTLVDDQRSFWKARHGIPADGPSQNTAEESFCQYVIASGERLIAGDVTQNPLTATNPSIEAMGVRAWAGFPLMSPDGQPLGSFCVVDTTVRTWSEQDVKTLDVLSRAAAREIALRSAAAQATDTAAQLQLLADVSHNLSGTLDIDEAVARLARLVIPTLGDWSLVTLADEDGTLTDVGWWHDRPSMRPVLDEFANARLDGLQDASPTTSAHLSHEPIVLNTGALEMGSAVLVAQQARDAYAQLNPGGYGVWPLTFGSAVHGLLIIARDADKPPFSPAEIELAGGIADRAGAVLDNARLYAQQQRISDELEAANAQLHETGRHDRLVSRALQNAMLTKLPEPDHLHIAARYLTADSHDQVGGDWYDAMLPPDGATTLIIGDVLGHDIAAATVMGQLRNLLRALAWEHDDEPPSSILARLDRIMPALGLTSMTTAVFARIEQTPDDAVAGLRKVRWSSAGHPVPILLDAAGRPRLLQGKVNPPLGIVRGIERHDNVAEIGPGQTLLLFTDGLVENRLDEIDARYAELLDVLGSAAGSDLDDTLDALLAGMVGNAPDDDVALIAVRFHPEDQPRPPEAGPPTA